MKQRELFPRTSLGLSPRRMRALTRRIRKTAARLHREAKPKETKAEKIACENGGTVYWGARR